MQKSLLCWTHAVRMHIISLSEKNILIYRCGRTKQKLWDSTKLGYAYQIRHKLWDRVSYKQLWLKLWHSILSLHIWWHPPTPKLEGLHQGSQRASQGNCRRQCLSKAVFELLEIRHRNLWWWWHFVPMHTAWIRDNMSMDVLHKQQYFVQSFCYIFIYLQLNDLLSLPLDSLYYFYYLSVCNKPCGNNKGVMIAPSGENLLMTTGTACMASYLIASD